MPETSKYEPNAQGTRSVKQIGETPLLAIRYRMDGAGMGEILVKCEQANPGGSMADRVALYILQRAAAQGAIRKGDVIVETGAGYTGIAYAAIGRMLGYRVKIILPETADPVYVATLKNYGAEPVMTGGSDSAACVRMAEAMADQQGVFLPHVFGQPLMTEAYERTIGREIGYSLLLENKIPAAFIAAETGGMLTGAGNYLRSLFPEIRVYELKDPTGTSDPANTAYRTPGFSLTSKSAPDDARLMVRKLAEELGIIVSISAGNHLLRAIRLQQETGADETVVTVFPDDGKYPVSRGPEDGIPEAGTVQADLLSPRIALLGQRALKKV